MSESKEHTRYAAIFAGGTMFSRVLGLVRDQVWAFFIPAAFLDIFIAAFRFPNMLREIVGEGASNAAFVPMFSKYNDKKSKKAYKELISVCFGAMILILGLITVVGIIVIPFIGSGIDFLAKFSPASEISAEKTELFIQVSMWTFPYLFMICLAVFCMAPLYTKGIYSLPSISPALLNVAFIAFAWLFRDHFPNPAWALVAGAWAGGLAQLGLQYWAMGRYTGVRMPSFKFNHPDLMTILLLLGPVLIGQAAAEVNRMIDILFAFTLPEGTVRSLFLANRMVQLPLSIFGVAVSVAILPTLSRKSSKKDLKAFQTTLLSGLRSSLYLVLPASVGLIILAHPIIHVAFERGYFGPEDTIETATAVRIYGAGLLCFAWVKILVIGFYSKQDTKSPVIISSLCMGMNILLNFVLIGPLGYKGLALATTLSFFLNAAFLYGILSVNVVKLWTRDYGDGLLKIVVSSVLMGIVAFGLNQMLQQSGFGGDAFWAALLKLILTVGVAAIFYGFITYSMKLEEAQNWYSIITRQKR